MVACCDLNESRLNAYGERYSIAGRYTKLAEMLEKEQPDVVHLVTPPTLRVELMTQLSAAGVLGVIVEKPMERLKN
jgi:predicted dehydrogenase